MIAQLATTAAFTVGNIASHLLYDVTEETLYLASLWACNTISTTTPQTTKTKVSICILPPGIAVPTTLDQLRARALIWEQELYASESFNIAGMALPKGTKIYVFASAGNVTFTATGTGM